MIDIQTTKEVIDFGFTLIPCKDDKKPYPFHGGDNWFKNAYKTIEQVKNTDVKMYAIRPVHKGLFALDLDRKREDQDGLVTLQNVCYEIGIDPEDLLKKRCYVETPSGGIHLYFKVDGIPISLTDRFCNGILNGIDTRCGGNGYIIAPGGYNPAYDAYYTLSGSFDDAPIMPKELINYLVKKAEEASQVEKKNKDDPLASFAMPPEDTLRGKIFKDANNHIKAYLDKIVQEHFPKAVKTRESWEMGSFDGETVGTHVKIARGGQFIGVANDWSTYTGATNSGVVSKNIFSMLADKYNINTTQAACMVIGMEYPARELSDEKAEEKGKMREKVEPENDDLHRDSKGFSLLTQPIDMDIIPDCHYKTDKKGNKTLVKSNKLAIDIINLDPAFRRSIVYDIGSMQPVFSSKFLSIDTAKRAVWSRLAAYGVDVNQNTLSMLENILEDEKVNTVLEFYESLEPYYRNEDPIDEMLGYFNFQKYGEISDEHNPEDDPKILKIYRETFRSFFMRQCARVYGFYKADISLPCDIVPTLRGNQGIGKGRFCRWLAVEDRFFEDLGNLTYKIGDANFVRALKGKLVGELGEMSKMRAAEVQEIKAFISGTHDTIIPKFKEGEVKTPRICCFIASTNDVNFFKDKTGNRRFFPVWLYDITPDLFEKKDLALRIWAYYWHIVVDLFKKNDIDSIYNMKEFDLNTLEAMRLNVVEMSPMASIIEHEVIEVEKTSITSSGEYIKMDFKNLHYTLSTKHKVSVSLESEIKDTLYAMGYRNRKTRFGQKTGYCYSIKKNDPRVIERTQELWVADQKKEQIPETEFNDHDF